MSTIAASFPATLERPRLLVTAVATLAAAFIILLGASSLILRSQLVETQAELATTQANLVETQANLATTQADLAATQAARDALSGQVDGLTGNVAQLTGERDGLKTDLDHARADVDRFTAELTAANADRDTSKNTVLLLGQAGQLLADVTKTYGEYDQVVNLQVNDLLAAYNAAIRLDAVTQRVSIQRYNDRLFLQGQKAAAVTQAIGRLNTFTSSRPSGSTA